MTASQNAATNPAAEQAITSAGPVVRLLDDGRRSRVVPLEWPIEIDGRVVDAVTVRRLNTKDVADFVAAVQSSPSGGDMRLFRFPMFFDIEGNKLSDAVIDALDDDDTATLTEVASDFLPRRFRVNDGDITPSTGDHTGLSSAE